MSEAAEQRAKRIFREHGGIMATKEALEAGIHRRTLYAMRDEGLLERVSRGRYRLAELPPLSNPDLATVALRAPKGVICLLSALAFHELTTQIPHEIYIALARGSEEPRIDNPPVRIFKFSGKAFTEGVEDHEVDGINMRIYGPAKTIADCFKFRNKLGMDVALESLKLFQKTTRFDVNELMHFARVCRVENLIMPYVEAML
jgi:predicted transcriptional regulator of viral defense system